MKYLPIIFILFSSLLLAQMEIPHSDPPGEIIRHTGFTLSYNEEHEQPNWVAYELTKTEVAGRIGRTNNFRPDSLISTGSAMLADYYKSGYDRGHLAPAGDMQWSKEAMSQSFCLSNISPQNSSFNRGIWKRAEDAVRKWAVKEGSVYVATAGILAPGLYTIGPSNVSIPEYFYKVVLDYTEPELKGIGFIMPNLPSSEPIWTFALSIDEVESRTGIDFFPMLPDSLEEAIESRLQISRWSF